MADDISGDFALAHGWHWEGATRLAGGGVFEHSDDDASCSHFRLLSEPFKLAIFVDGFVAFQHNGVPNRGYLNSIVNRLHSGFAKYSFKPDDGGFTFLPSNIVHSTAVANAVSEFCQLIKLAN